MGRKQLFEEMKQILEQGDDLVLVTVIAGSGSTPRGAGARMIVRKDGIPSSDCHVFHTPILILQFLPFWKYT